MEIIKGKRKAKCWICWKPITTKHRVSVEGKRNHHLSCYYKAINNKINRLKPQLKKLNRYKKYFILEKL